MKEPSYARVLPRDGDFAAPDENYSKLGDRLDRKRERINSRIWELDFIRGICVMLMIFDHLMYDLWGIFAPAWKKLGIDGAAQLLEQVKKYWVSDLRETTQSIVIFLFIFICGISCSFSRSNLKRAILLVFVSLGITLVTTMIEIPIIFGIIHMFAASLLLWCAVYYLCRKKKGIAAVVSFVIGVGIIIAGLFITEGSVAVNDSLAWLARPFQSEDYYSADNFTIIPYTGYLLVGYSFGVLVYGRRRSVLPSFDTPYRWYAPVNWFGRHALIWYVLHQIMWVVILEIVTVIFITPGQLIPI